MKKTHPLFPDLINHLLFVILFIYASTYYKERLFADSGYYIYRVIDSNFFVVELNRFILLFSQVLPVITIKLGCSLKTVLISYSVWHVLFFYILFLISRYCYKNHVAGILLILLQTIGIRDGYFTPMFELYYGVGFLVLLASILYKGGHAISDRILMVILSLIILTSHPFTYFLLLSILLFHFIKHRWEYVTYYIVAIVLIILVMIYKNHTANDYERGKTNNIIYQLHNGIYNWDYIKSLLHFLFKYYKDLLVLGISTIIYFVLRKEYIKGILSIGIYLFFIALVNLAYYGFEHSRYQEQVYFPLAFIVSFIFVFIAINNFSLRNTLVIYCFLAVLVIFRLIWISVAAVDFTYRITTAEKLIEKCQSLKGNKFVIKEKDIVPEKGIGTNWSYPMETMLLSKINPRNKTVTVCTEDDMLTNDNRSKLRPENYLMRSWDIRDDASVNQKYFHLNDGEYITINAK